MKKFQVDLVAKLIGFIELTVEAESAEEAEKKAKKEAGKLPHYDWDVQYVEYTNLPYGTVYEIEVNEMRELSEPVK